MISLPIRQVFKLNSVVIPRCARYFSTATPAPRVVDALNKELEHETKHNGFKITDKEGSINLKLSKSIGEKQVDVDFQLTAPVDPEIYDEEEQEQTAPAEQSTDFTVTVTKPTGEGVKFYCSTHSGEGFRYAIGNIKTFESAESTEIPLAYSGPEFDDLDEALQDSLDNYLADIGVTNELCAFIDTMALDKEQREYISWLKSMQKVLE